MVAGGVTYTGRRRTINVSVSDVSDSAPVFPNKQGVQYLEKSVEITDGSDSVPVRVIYDPPHDKTTKPPVRLSKTQISLGISPVWSEPSLCALWVARDTSYRHVDSEDSDQSGPSHEKRDLRVVHC